MALNVERHQQIEQLIRANGRATVEELSARFGVSPATIRRDLERLAGAGLLQRAHGGAVALERAAPEPPVASRAGERADEKQRIGRAAAALIGAGETIFLGSGSTTLAVARHLHGTRGLKVITNALTIANELAGSPEISLIITGGLLRSSEQSMLGHLAEQALRQLRADKAVIGIRAISAAEGLTSDYGAETSADRAILACAPQLLLVADHSKLGRVANVVLAPASAVHTLVTGGQAPDDQLGELRRLGVRVVLV